MFARLWQRPHHVLPSRSCTPYCVVSCPLAQPHAVQCPSPRERRHWLHRFRRQSFAEQSSQMRVCCTDFAGGNLSEGFADRDLAAQASQAGIRRRDRVDRSSCLRPSLSTRATLCILGAGCDLSSVSCLGRSSCHRFRAWLVYSAII